MKSSVTKTFFKQLSGLPAPVQEQAVKAYEHWKEDPYHPSLQFKRVSQRQPITPFVSVLTIVPWVYWSPIIIYWYWIGSHNKYDELLKRM